MTTLKITLKKSLIGRLPKHIRTAKALGLNKTHGSVTKEANPCILGMVKQIHYLLDVQELT